MLKKFKAFYPEYLEAYSNEGNRRLHFIGATLCFAFIFISAFSLQPAWLLAAVVAGYLFPHWGHRHYEKNASMRVSHPVFCVLGASLLYFQQWRKILFGK